MLEPGAYEKLSNEAYHGDKRYYSSSSLKVLLENPYLFYKKYIARTEGFKSVGSAAMDLGSYVHSIILEPHKTDSEFSVYDGRKSGPEWRLFQENNKKKIIINQKAKELGDKLKIAVSKHKAVSELLQGGHAEYSFLGELMGEKIKVRADYINIEKNYILDIKTTAKPLTREALMGSIANLHYDLSAALYADTFKQINNVSKLDFYFVFVNTKDTFDVEVFKSSDMLLNNGRRKYRKAIRILKESLKSGIWKSEEVEEIDVPFWALLPEEFDNE